MTQGINVYVNDLNTPLNNLFFVREMVALKLLHKLSINTAFCIISFVQKYVMEKGRERKNGARQSLGDHNFPNYLYVIRG